MEELFKLIKRSILSLTFTPSFRFFRSRTFHPFLYVIYLTCANITLKNCQQSVLLLYSRIILQKECQVIWFVWIHFFIRILFLRPRLNILVFLPVEAENIVVNILRLAFISRESSRNTKSTMPTQCQIICPIMTLMALKLFFLERRTLD